MSTLYPLQVLTIAAGFCLVLGACEAPERTYAAADVGKSEGLVRGRVTDVDGNLLQDVEVQVGGAKTRTDAEGRFTLKVERGADLRLSVESDMLSAASVPVKTEREPANLEITVKPRKRLMLASAKHGGRVEADDGFAVELPEDALVDDTGASVSGEVELRYALIRSPDEVTAAPGRMQTEERDGLDGYGMAELRFYQQGRRVMLKKEIQVELPMHDEHDLVEGEEVDVYELGARDVRWHRNARASVRNNKLQLRTSRDEWLGGAKKLAVDSCMSGSLGTGEQQRLVNTTIRAARERGLALIQAETGSDGSFCLPVTPNDDWRVSTFHDDGNDAYGLEVELHSAQASGMCGGDGCKSVGDVTLPKIEKRLR